MCHHKADLSAIAFAQLQLFNKPFPICKCSNHSCIAVSEAISGCFKCQTEVHLEKHKITLHFSWNLPAEQCLPLLLPLPACPFQQQSSQPALLPSCPLAQNTAQLMLGALCLSAAQDSCGHQVMRNQTLFLPHVLPSPSRMQVTCGSAVTVLLFQLRAATVHHNMSACHQFYTVNINYWLQLWETLLSLTLTPIYILLYLGFLIVNSTSQKPLWSTITVAILTVENKQKKIWMELNEFSNPKLPSAISLCYDTEIKPHSWHTKELSTHALWACIQGLVVILRPLPMRNSIKLLEEENSHPGLPAVLILLCPNEHSQCPQKAAEEKKECQLSGTQL